MAAAIAVALTATLLGVLLALLPATSARLLGPIRTFALTASLAVVLTHLVPEGFAELGSTALFVFLLGALLPIAIEAIVRRLWLRHEARVGHQPRVGLEAGYAGLLVHKIGDGIGLGAYGGLLAEGGAKLDVMIALAAHTVPVVAVVMLAFESLHGRRAGLIRAAGIALAILVGVLLAGLVPVSLARQASAWVAACVSGLLLHVVMHDLEAHSPRTASDRTFDLGAALLGFSLPAIAWLGGHAHELDRAGELAERLGRSFVDLSLDTAPMLLVGLLAGALIQSFGSRIPESWLAPRGSLSAAVRGAIVGAPLPLCSCSVLPVSGALARRAQPALVVAFLLATPELGVETFALSVRFLGWPFALLRVLGALAVAIVAALVVQRIAAAPLASTGEPPLSDPSSRPNPLKRTIRAFDELLHHIGAWMVVGIAAAALIEALIPAEAFGAISHPLVELVVVTAIAVPSYICAPSATPLAAVLIAKGLSPGAVLIGLLLGPATNLATLAFLRKTYGTRATVLSLSAVVALSWLLALSTNRLLSTIDVHAHAVFEHETRGIVTLLAAGLFALLLLRSIWQSGVRGWLASLAEIGGAHSHSHAHAHPHPHDHSHA